MLKKGIATALLALGPVALGGPADLGGPAALEGQEGTIKFLRSVQLDMELPEGMPAQMRDRLPTETTAALVLRFDGARSVMMPDGEQDGASNGSGPGGREERRARGMARWLTMMSSSRRDRENILNAYVDFETGAITETRDFMGRTFLIVGERPRYEWKLGTEQKELLGYMVQQATTVHEGAEVEAWFTPQIPVPAGPGSYGGLPGMILALTEDRGKVVYFPTGIDLSGLEEGAITPPGEGDMVTAEEYEAVVAEKLEEMRSMRGAGPGNRRRPPF